MPCRPSSKSRKLSCECALLTRSSHYLPWLISRFARKNRRILSVPRVAVPVINSSIQVSAVAATPGLFTAPNNIHCYARFSRRAPGAGPDDYRFEFTQNDSAVWVTAAGGKQRRSVKVDWAFGSGNQGITFVSRLSSQSYLEHSLSYYPLKHSFGLTPAHERFKPDTLEAALGIAFQTYGPGGEIQQCFQCHSTGPLMVSADDAIEPNELGIGCEACHGGGSSHRNHVQAGELELARASITRLRGLDGIQVNGFCGNCHRSQVQGRASIDLNYVWNVRHQPPYLERSACFQSSSGRLSCLTCHDPHQPLRKNDPPFTRPSACPATDVPLKPRPTPVLRTVCPVICHWQTSVQGCSSTIIGLGSRRGRSRRSTTGRAN